MANYTIELKEIVKSGYNIFDFPYEFYDEHKRREFEQNFIRHFYFREIGCETVDRFKLYLEDKMRTVFPYYNKLFETTLIEYNILDNYYMKESTTTTRENIGKSHGVSSTIGQNFEDQQSTTKDSRTTDTEGTSKQNASETSETNRNGTKKSEASENMTSNASETVTENKEEIKKFLDTPQGAVNLSDSKYLTTLNHDTGDRTTTSERDETTGKTSEGSETTSETENATAAKNANGETTEKQVQDGNEETVFKGEQRSTADNNTRLETMGNQKEVIEHSRRGNIGIDTDSDMIQKHMKLQKVLKRIELMFFDECEDLFMLVY